MSKSILEIFIITADAGSFEKASKQLFISSTALIKQIKRLEQETSLTLFHRTNRGISLTTSGKIFYDASIKIISDYKTAIQTAQNLERKYPETLRIGISMINPYINVANYISYETKFHAKFNIAIVPIECNYNAFWEQFKTLGQTIDAIPYILDNKELDLICNSFHIANFSSD